MLIQRQRCPGLVRYAPSPQVGVNAHFGQVTNGGMFLDLCIFLCCRPLVFSVLRDTMSEPCLNFLIFAGHLRVGTHDMHDLHYCFIYLEHCFPLLRCRALLHIGRQCWSQNIRFHFRVIEQFSCFKAKEQCSVNVRFHLGAFCKRGKRSGSVFFARQKEAVQSLQ